MLTAEERIAELEAELAALRAQVAALLTQNQQLQARLAKDSHNSSKPPSTDPIGRKRPRSQRRRSGKKPGGQLGHPGETLRLVATPDELVEHRPAVCAACQAPLEASAPAEGYERRQVHELPPVRLLVREHRALHVRCPACAQVSVGSFPAEAPSRAQYGPRLRALAVYLVEQQLIPDARVRELFADLFGAHVSLGTLTRWVRQGAEALRPVEEAITAALRRAPVLHVDETSVRRAGRLAWAHVSCTARLTHYAIHAKRGREATDAIGILPAYRGVSVHDGWKPYRTYAQCRHALCNIHHLRELTFLEEQYQQAWATGLKALLLAMNAAVARARARGEQCLPKAERRAFVARYEELLAAGLAANPPPEREPGRRGRVKQSPARNLLERLWLGQEEVLAFLDDVTIPFDNKSGRAGSAPAQSPAKDRRLVPGRERLGGIRSDPRLLRLAAQAGRGAPGRPADGLHRPAALPCLGLNSPVRGYATQHAPRSARRVQRSAATDARRAPCADSHSPRSADLCARGGRSPPGRVPLLPRPPAR
jgi:transposase